MVPTTGVEATKQVTEMKSLGVSTLYLTGDGSPYGLTLAAALRKAASGAGIAIASAPGQAQGAFYAGASVPGAARAFQSATTTSPAIKLFAPSALDDPALVSALGSASRNLYVSVPTGNGGPAATKFASDFKAAFGHAPAQQAVFGYAAMQAVLFALRQAGSSVNDRAKVIDQFSAIRNNVPNSVIGPYTINANGDTSLASFVLDRVRHGVLIPVK
jgi:hypothetical protein